MFAGPGLEGGATIGFARLVDMTPTLLELLGEREGLSADPAMDGVSIASLLRAARRGS
jgi:arylsulfatase A-like enzyme